MSLTCGASRVRPQLAFASYRLAVSNGWVFSLPWSRDEAAVAPTAAAPPASAEGGGAAASAAVDGSGGDVGGLLTILAWSIVGSYIVKYGETLLPFVLDSESLVVPVVATLMIAGVTGFNVYKWQQRSQEETDFGGLI